jgi:hypothetical protein
MVFICPYCGSSKVRSKESKDGNEYGDVWYNYAFLCNNCNLKFEPVDLINDSAGLQRLKILLDDKKFLEENIKDTQARLRDIELTISKAKPELLNRLIAEKL